MWPESKEVDGSNNRIPSSTVNPCAGDQTVFITAHCIARACVWSNPGHHQGECATTNPHPELHLTFYLKDKLFRNRSDCAVFRKGRAERCHCHPSSVMPRPSGVMITHRETPYCSFAPSDFPRLPFLPCFPPNQRVKVKVRCYGILMCFQNSFLKCFSEERKSNPAGSSYCNESSKSSLSAKYLLNVC